MAEQIVKQEKQLVVQSNPLVEAQYRLDMLAQKIIRYLVSKIIPNDQTFKNRIYTLVVQDFCEVVDREYHTKVFQDIRAAAEKLLSTKITIRRGKEVTRTAWIASYKYHENEGWFEFSLSTHLERELLKIKDQFTRYYLKNISKLKSQYSIRLYELLLQYLQVGQRRETISDIRAMLGIGENEYIIFRDFKRWVLKKAQSEICKKTDIDFDFKVEKISRKPVAIVFYDIRQKTHIPDRVLSLIPKKYQDNKQILSTIRKYLEVCGEDYVVEKLHYTNSRNPKRWTDYLWKACEYNYGEGFTPQQDIETVQDPEIRAEAENRRQEKELKEKLQEEYFRYKSKVTKDYLSTLEACELEESRKSFEKNLSNNFLRTIFSESGFDSPMIKSEYMEFIYGKYVPEDARISFPDYLKSVERPGGPDGHPASVRED